MILRYVGRRLLDDAIVGLRLEVDRVRMRAVRATQSNPRIVLLLGSSAASGSSAPSRSADGSAVVKHRVARRQSAVSLVPGTAA